jgi:hypothetical protein
MLCPHSPTATARQANQLGPGRTELRGQFAAAAPSCRVAQIQKCAGAKKPGASGSDASRDRKHCAWQNQTCHFPAWVSTVIRHGSTSVRVIGAPHKQHGPIWTCGSPVMMLLAWCRVSYRPRCLLVQPCLRAGTDVVPTFASEVFADDKLGRDRPLALPHLRPRVRRHAGGRMPFVQSSHVQPLLGGSSRVPPERPLPLCKECAAKSDLSAADKKENAE